MHLKGLGALRAAGRGAIGAGPVALIFAEDDVEIPSTLAHHRDRGFRRLLLFAPPRVELPAGLVDHIRVDWSPDGPGSICAPVDTVIAMAPGTWLYYGYNAECLFHPFSDTRSVSEMLAFHAEERRAATLAYVVDLYAGDLGAAPSGVSLGDAHLDGSGYYALARHDPADPHARLDRQMDFYGGLGWRFEDHVPQARRRIDRIALFRARRGLRLRPNHTLTDEECNTFACPWHNNLTAAICSFRTAKALRGDPASRAAAARMTWRNSIRFDWSADQLLALGLMEPGQWF